MGLFLSEFSNKGKLCCRQRGKNGFIWSSSHLAEEKSTCCFSLAGFGWTLVPGASCVSQSWEGGKEGTRAGLLLGWGEPKLQSNSLRKEGKSLKESEGSGESRGRS